MRYVIRWFKCKLKPPKNDGMEIDALSLLGFTDEQNDVSDEDEVLFTTEELIGEEIVRTGVKRKRTEECL